MIIHVYVDFVCHVCFLFLVEFLVFIILAFKASNSLPTERILSVGRELDALEARMMNPRYVEKAPAELVQETRDGIEEKKALIERLKKELEVI